LSGGSGVSPRYLFIGEKPSETAKAKGWTWESGRLAALTLFRALRHCDINPEDRVTVQFLNLFGDDPEVPEVADQQRLGSIRSHSVDGWTIVAMGSKVSSAMLDVPHLKIAHPAARGLIRGKSVYMQHVKNVLMHRGE
jgi:hypothetical protein